MCGIFGILNKERVDFSQFFELGEANKRRGNLAFGYLVGKAKEDSLIVDTDVFRYTTPFEESLVSQERANVLLAHIRAPTGAQSDRLTDVHPFEADDGYLAHNGLILNHAAFPQWCAPGYSVDSEVITGGIQHHLDQGAEIIEAIKSTVEPLEGQQACWYWHKPEQCLYLWRVMSPIYVSESEQGLCFSSINTEYASRLLTEGVIYRYSLSLSSLVEAGSFAFQSAYLNL